MADLVATAEPLALNSGSPNVATLSIGGQPLAQAIVTAIHRTDWQGRQLLYATPRTNLIPGTLIAGSGSSIGATVTGPDGNAGSGYSATLAPTGPGLYQGYGASVGAAYTLAIWLRGTVDGQIVGLTHGGNESIVPVALSTQWQRYPLTQSALATTQYLEIVGTGSSNQQIEYAFGQVETGTDATAYIPTTTAPVTVTDYSQSGNQITLGQNPATAATLDWDGSGILPGQNWSWPLTLPPPVADGALKYAPITEPVLATNMDTGAPKYRRRMTYVPETMQATVEITGDQWTTLIDFYNTTLACVNPFDWKDFRTGGTATYMFTKRPAPTQMQDQPKYWSVQLNLLKVA